MSIVQLADGDRMSEAMPAAGVDQTLLLVAMVRLRRGRHGFQLDDQTCAGLVRWAEHFKEVVYCGLLQESDESEDGSTTWVDVDCLPNHDRMRIVPLPLAYKIGAFARTYRATRRLLAEEIRKADKLCFTLGYVFGDWGGVAALEAIKQGRRFGTWFDRVEHEVLRNTLHSLRFRRRIKEGMMLPVMMAYHRHLVRRSSLGLFQGMDTFKAYEKYSTNPACVYDVHTQPEDFIGMEQVEQKVAELESGGPLRIVYVGRAAAMKGPEDWLRVIHGIVQAGVDVRATWLGDGPLLEQMRATVTRLGLNNHIELAGFVGDRGRVLDVLQQSHLFLFCHKTPESPRCLIEALVAGCPIAGYGTHYSKGLVEDAGGGIFSAMNDVEGLVKLIADLDRDRSRLVSHVRDAASCGRRFDESTVYRHRAELIAAHA